METLWRFYARANYWRGIERLCEIAELTGAKYQWY